MRGVAGKGRHCSKHHKTSHKTSQKTVLTQPKQACGLDHRRRSPPPPCGQYPNRVKNMSIRPKTHFT